MLQKEAIWQELEQFHVTYDAEASLADFGRDMYSLFRLTGERTKAKEPHTIASVLMRHAAFLFVARLYALSKFRLEWTGDISHIRLADRELNGRWSPQWVLSEGNWVSLNGEAEAFEAIQKIICLDCRSLVEEVAVRTNSSAIVLWENIWGYILWMYVQLLKQPGDESVRTRADLELLLDSETWKGIERRSPFQKFINGQTPEAALANYARLTCCFYYTIPGNEKCSYCPKLPEKRKEPGGGH